jgi:hypothetical protein
MNRQRGKRAVVFRPLLLRYFHWPRAAMPPPRPHPCARHNQPVSGDQIPDVTEKASTGPNETSVGKPIASRSVVFASADGKKKLTLSVDQYASASDAAAAYQTAVQGSKAAPGFKPAASPNLGQEAFAGTSQVGAEMHFGLGARDGRLIMSATHAGDIPVTPDNSNNLISLGGAEFITAKQVLGRSGSS